jgi:hypothetical protein
LTPPARTTYIVHEEHVAGAASPRTETTP